MNVGYFGWECCVCCEHATTVNHYLLHQSHPAWASWLFCDRCAALEIRDDELVSVPSTRSRYERILYPGKDSDVDICIERLMEVLCSI